ncbi:10147_t:CDS:2 [Ambispora gerdemannii]|uniref:10147_t:CDS:1 n=1 Tax=Ambispora gerdemannii TaxID=144530 RepID=A0A9N9DM93_9GLOM|nr:10147_t:CDS:2 [Ambispora gerdemannii]
MTFLAEGNHAVRNLLHSPYFTFKKILLREEHRQDKELLQLLEKKQITYQLLDKEQFARYGFAKKNQGIVAFIRNYDYVSLNYLLNRQPSRKYPLIIMLDSIEDPHNFGAILRTSAALAIDGVIISKKNQVPVNSTVVRVSVGGAAYVPICQVDNLAVAINELRKSNYKIISTICEPGAAEYNKFNFDFSTALIFGNEHEGIKPSLIKKSDYSLYIPMNNNISSLNVSTTIFCKNVNFTFNNAPIRAGIEMAITIKTHCNTLFQIPDNKNIRAGLTNIYGIGWSTAEAIISKLHIASRKRIHDLSETELKNINQEIKNFTTEEKLREEKQKNISEQIRLGTYRGLRLSRKPNPLPVNGQRTRHNSRTAKGHKRITVANKKKAPTAK